MSYHYQEPTPRTYGALPEGDYSAVVIECGEPYVSQTGKDVIVVKLAIQPSGRHVWYRPWAGKTKDGEYRDNIAEFLKAVNRAPKAGEEPNWNAVLGAKGKCKLKVREYNGDKQNDVAFFYVPRETKTATVAPPKAGSVSQSEFEKARQAQINQSVGGITPEPDELPY
jgi:hypothetical protein